jgi:DNA-binding NtrC family response regulator
MNNKPRVLLIDDEPDILEVMSMMLTRDGFEISLAASGEEALGILKSHVFDVVVCDFMMPKMDGITMLKQVRANKDYTPYIFFSGNADDSHGTKMVGLGAYELLPKTQIKNLSEVIKKTIKHNEGIKNLGHESSEQSEEFLSLLYSTKI